MATKSADLKSALAQLEGTLETYLVDKAPFAIPAEWKELIVKFSPWLTLIMMIVVLPPLLGLLGLGAILTPFSYIGGISYGINYTVGLIFSAVILVIEALAIPGLFKRSIGGWRMVFYATLLNAVQNLISFNIGGLIIGSLISFYVLFQVKSYYK